MDLVLSAKIVLGTFGASTLTALLLCYYNNVPFFNPNHNKYQFYSRFKQVVISTSTVLFYSTLFGSVLVTNFMDRSHHTFLQTANNIIVYSVTVEFLYYIYHRIIHTKYFYKTIHSLHHQNIEVYPFDTFFMTKVDAVFLILSLSVPLFMLHMNLVEHVVCIYIYGTAAYLEHSNILVTHHTIHHKLLFCNFCILNPIFDILVGTYK